MLIQYIPQIKTTPPYFTDSYPHRPSPTAPTLPAKLSLFNTPKHAKTNRAERKSQFKSNIAPITRIPNLPAYGTDKPHLRHTHDGAKDAEAKGKHGGHAGRQQTRVVPDADVVSAPFEDEVLAQGDAFVDG